MSLPEKVQKRIVAMQCSRTGLRIATKYKATQEKALARVVARAAANVKRMDKSFRRAFFNAGGTEMFVEESPGTVFAILKQRTTSETGRMEIKELGRWHKITTVTGENLASWGMRGDGWRFKQLVAGNLLPSAAVLVNIGATYFFKEKGRWKKVWKE